MDCQQDVNHLKQQGRYNEALGLLEQEYSKIYHRYGPQSSLLQSISSQLSDMHNLVAITHLQTDRLYAAYESLKKAESFATDNPEMLNKTFNNFACYYRRHGKIKSALDYLEKALQIQVNPDTRLNLCAVLSQAGKHEQALENSMHAVIALMEEFMYNTNRNDAAPMLAIAYHNVAVELEHLNRYGECLEYYDKAVAFAIKNLPRDHSIIQVLENARTNTIDNMQGQGRTRVQKKLNVLRQRVGRKVMRSTSPLFFKKEASNLETLERVLRSVKGQRQSTGSRGATIRRKFSRRIGDFEEISPVGKEEEMGSTWRSRDSLLERFGMESAERGNGSQNGARWGFESVGVSINPRQAKKLKTQVATELSISPQYNPQSSIDLQQFTEPENVTEQLIQEEIDELFGSALLKLNL